ncbi:MAG: helix-turn-helix transcriptional regulator [Pirellulaceae bacterium]|nr:helix-turn-helix transcriptional regulator [Pirellulaceae bacterium]
MPYIEFIWDLGGRMMAKKQAKRRSRGRYLTDEEAAKYDTIREQVAAEFSDRIKKPTVSPVAHAAIMELKQAREALGLSLADIRDRTGIERSALSRLENETPNVTIRTLERYAEALGKRIVIEIADARPT